MVGGGGGRAPEGAVCSLVAETITGQGLARVGGRGGRTRKVGRPGARGWGWPLGGVEKVPHVKWSESGGGGTGWGGVV